MQQSVEGEHAQLGLIRVAGFARLAFGDTRGNDQVTDTVPLEAEDVGRIVLAAIFLVEGAHPRVGDQRDAELTARGTRREAGQPAAQTAVSDAPSAAVT